MHTFWNDFDKFFINLFEDVAQLAFISMNFI